MTHMRRFLIILTVFVAVAQTSITKEPEMGVGGGTGSVGAQYGYSPEAWNALPQAQKNAIRGGIGPIGAAAGFQPAQSAPAPPASISAPGPTWFDWMGYNAQNPTQQDQQYDPYGPSGSGSASSAYSLAYEEPYPTLPAPKLLSEAPEWLAYLSALGFEQSAYEADIARQKDVYSADASRRSAEIGPQFQEMRRGVTGNLENRGMARSGELLRRLAENRQGEGRAQSGIASQLGAQLSSLESSLASRIAELSSRRAQQELALRMQGYQ